MMFADPETHTHKNKQFRRRDVGRRTHRDVHSAHGPA